MLARLELSLVGYAHTLAHKYSTWHKRSVVKNALVYDAAVCVTIVISFATLSGELTDTVFNYKCVGI
jgi:hypothetical protein